MRERVREIERRSEIKIARERWRERRRDSHRQIDES